MATITMQHRLRLRDEIARDESEGWAWLAEIHRAAFWAESFRHAYTAEAVTAALELMSVLFDRDDTVSAEQEIARLLDSGLWYRA